MSDATEVPLSAVPYSDGDLVLTHRKVLLRIEDAEYFPHVLGDSDKPADGSFD